MLKYEATRKIFSQLLHHSYEAVEVDLLDGWKLRAEVSTPKVDAGKPYLGSIPISVDFYQGMDKKKSYPLNMRFIQTTLYPSLEDEEGGYAFLIRSSASELLFRAMQAAKYEIEDDHMTVKITTDLSSKRGDAGFHHKMMLCIRQFEPLFQQWGGEMAGKTQFTYATYLSETDTFVQEKQNILKMSLLLAVCKAVLKGELDLPLSSLMPEQDKARQPRIWKISPGSQAIYWDYALADGNIFIGWPDLGDLRQYTTKEQLRDAYLAAYNPEQEPSNNLDSLWGFCQEIKPGDIVVANKGWKSLVGIGRVTGEYDYQPDESDYPNIRTVEWIVTSPVVFASNVFHTPTVTPVPKKHLDTIKQGVLSQVSQGAALWDSLFGDAAVGPASTQETLADNFHRYLQANQFWYSSDFVQRFVTSLQTKPFIILSGSSGTGKTKIAQYFAEYMRFNDGVANAPADLTASGMGSSNDGRKFHLQLYPYTFEYQRMIVTVEMLEWVDLDLSAGVEIDVRFGGQNEKSLMKRQGNAVRLGFRKNFMAWLKQEFKIGDHLMLTILDGGKVFSFEKEASSSFSQDDSNLAFVSVRPDWLDHRGLLGYYNPLTDKYDPTPLLKLMLQAEGDPDRPYFVILDEMNLAKVEYYFSDFLSCMESRRLDPLSGQMVQEPLNIHQLARPVEHVDENNRVYLIPAKLPIPPNVYIIGTVNIDETTYMFSPKVLDRANVIECSEIDIPGYWLSLDLAAGNPECTPLKDRLNLFTNDGQYHFPLYSKDFLQPENRALLEDAFRVVLRLHGLLEEEGHAFGYRVLDEVMTYLLLSVQNDNDILSEALDAQIVQKILPKLHGNRKQLERLLKQLLEQFINGSLSGDPLSAENREMLEIEESYVYPLSGRKVFRMYKQLVQTGYCSFVC